MEGGRSDGKTGVEIGGYDWLTMGDLGRMSLWVFGFIIPVFTAAKLRDYFSAIQLRKDLSEA